MTTIEDCPICTQVIAEACNHSQSAKKDESAKQTSYDRTAVVQHSAKEVSPKQIAQFTDVFASQLDQLNRIVPSGMDASKFNILLDGIKEIIV